MDEILEVQVKICCIYPKVQPNLVMELSAGWHLNYGMSYLNQLELPKTTTLSEAD
jgi:hypothetical protein